MRSQSRENRQIQGDFHGLESVIILDRRALSVTWSMAPPLFEQSPCGADHVCKERRSVAWSRFKPLSEQGAGGFDHFIEEHRVQA